MTDQDGGATGGEPPRADLGEETRKIVSAVQEWARRAFPEPASGHGGPECQWCPLCQFASVLRGERPEVSEKVAEAGTALANALKALVDSAVAHAPAGGPAGAGEPRAKPRPAPRVQHIRLVDSDPDSTGPDSTGPDSTGPDSDSDDRA